MTTDTRPSSISSSMIDPYLDQISWRPCYYRGPENGGISYEVQPEKKEDGEIESPKDLCKEFAEWQSGTISLNGKASTLCRKPFLWL